MTYYIIFLLFFQILNLNLYFLIIFAIISCSFFGVIMKIIFILFLTLFAINSFAGSKLPFDSLVKDKLKDDLKKNLKKLTPLGHIQSQLIKIKEAGGDFLGYSDNILLFMEKWYDMKVEGTENYSDDNSSFSRRRREEIDFYSLLSGGIAIRESLQLGSISASYQQIADIDISTLNGPDIQSFPFSKMLGKTIVQLESLSEFIPENFYYVYFKSLNKGLNFYDYIINNVSAIYKKYQQDSIDYYVKEKILNQLAIKENKDSRVFYDMVLEEVAITGSDFFIRSGTDVTFIFKLKNPVLFKTTINIYRADFVKNFGAKKESFSIDKYKGDYISTKDKKVNSYYLEIDEKTVLISNSLDALKVIVKKDKTLAKSDEYKYMRSIYKYNSAEEDIFVYLSDSFIRYLVSPQLRIKESRRMFESLRMAELERLNLFYYQLNKKYPKNVKELLTNLASQSTKVNKKEFDESYKDVFKNLSIVENSFKATSLQYGTIGYLKPNFETTIKMISNAESVDYKTFVESYHSFWKDYFDPIGIRVKFDGKKAKIQTHILPLINNSMYNQVKAFLGGEPVTVKNSVQIKGDILNLIIKLNPEVKQQIHKVFDELRQQGFSPTALDLDEVMENYIELYMHDTTTLVDFNSNTLFNEFLRTSSRLRFDEAGLFVMIWSLFHPLRMSIPLKDAEKGKMFIEQMEKFVSQIIIKDSWIRRESDISFYTLKYNNLNIKAVKIELFKILTFRLYYFIVNNKFHITTTENYAKKVIDSQTSTTVTEKRGNIFVEFKPNQIDLEKSAYTANIIENLQKISFQNIPTLKLLINIFGQNALNNTTVKTNVKTNYFDELGFDLSCPAKGNYIYSDDIISNSVFGTFSNPVIDLTHLENNYFKDFFNLNSIAVSLEFTETGIDTILSIE